MKNVFLLPWCGAIAFILSACGDTVENVNQMGMDVVDSVADLPKCNDKNEGELAYVKGEPSARICVEGEWFATKADEGSSAAPDFSCKTEELKDGSGVKIVCNGDSIGVVLNGEKGEAGENGKGCDVAEYADSLVTIVCGDKSITMNLGAGSISVGTFVPDSEKVAISLDSLAGYSQKGPFLKGSTVYLYELSDGRTLKQTNGNFTSIITRDDGRYKFTARDLASQYAMVVVDGNYRNEVTGKPSNASIRLRALTDMRKRSNVNVNLLTHLEFDRVYYLVTREHKTVKQAKKQAQAEIFNAFHIDTTGIESSAEDLDVFGKTDADAALLAISIMLQGDGSETDLSVLLTEIANDMETDGKWDGPGSDSVKAALADAAMSNDEQGKLVKYRSNVSDWALSTTVPDFEKHIRRFASIENGLGLCGSDSTPVGTVKNVSNPKSKKYYVEKYTDVTGAGGKIRFTCVDADSAKWRKAIDIEKDTMSWGAGEFDGEVRKGQINQTIYYIYETSKRAWRNATLSEKDNYDYIRNRKWDDGTDGETRKGSVSGATYIWKSNKWVNGELFFDMPWYVYTDTWGSSIAWDSEFSTIQELLNSSSANTFKIVLGNNEYPYAGIGVGWDSQDNGHFKDYKGICISYSSTIDFFIKLHAKNWQLTEGDDYEVAVAKSAITQTVDFLWTDFKQEGWGKTVSLNDAVNLLYHILLEASGDAGTSGEFTILFIGPYGGCGAN